MTRLLAFSPIFAVWWLSLAGCSDPRQVVNEQASPTNTKMYSAEDRRIAKALSLGGYELQAAASPYDQAILCTAALEALGGRLEESGALTNAQQQAFKQVQALYTKRAASGGKAAAQVVQDRRAVETAYPDKNVLGRIAIGCLRELT